ncbi:hypothetical protein [Halomicrococcus sp. NG-SE-24]|uniref:hypothetical protein n=1 Tax=Halomicrococcus sp. NG-SE-24 TaxID=3436928 RepID=UPI003D97CE4A
MPEDPSEAFLSELAATDAIRVLDLKGQYGPDVGAPADPELYRRLFETFLDVIVEDPAVTDATRDVLEAHADRISWDAPVTDVESVRKLPWEPASINVKPCRFRTLESLCRFLEYALEYDIDLYGGGMFELDVGRAQPSAGLVVLSGRPERPRATCVPSVRGRPAAPVESVNSPEEPSGIGGYSG